MALARPSPRVLRGLLGVAFLLIGVVAVVQAVQEDNDFDGFHRAARHLCATGTFSPEKNVARYPPTFQVLHLPFGALPLGVAAAAWYLLSVAALLATPRQVERLCGVPRSEQLGAWLVMAPFVVDNLLLGQSGPVLLWLASAGLARAREGGAGRASRAALGGAALGLAALFKVLPAALLAVPLLLGRARAALAGFAAALLLGALATVLAVGAEDAAAASASWTRVVASQSPGRLLEADRSLRYNNQGLGVTLARTFCEIGAVDAKGRVALARWPLEAAWVLLGLALAAVLVLSALAARRARALGPDRDEAWLGLFATFSLASLLLAPVVWTHYFLWLLPGLLALRRRRRLLLWGGAAFVLALALVPARGLGFHAWSTFLLLVLVVAELGRLRREPPPAPSAARRRLRVADLAEREHLAGAGNWLWRIPWDGGFAVLKVYSGNRSPLLHLRKTLGNALTGRTSHLPAARCRYERACLDLWERHALRVFRRIPDVVVEDLPPDDWILFAYEPGRHFRDLFRDESVAEDEKIALWRRFVREWHRRHRLAVDLCEPRLIQENGDVKHVLLREGELLWLDLEVGYRSRNVRDLVGREVRAYGKSVGKFFGEERYERLLDELVLHYPDKALLYEAWRGAWRHGNPWLRGLRALDRGLRPRHAKRFSKYRVAADLGARLDALSLGGIREGNRLWRIDTGLGPVVQKLYQDRPGGLRNLLRALLAGLFGRKTLPGAGARRATERRVLALWRAAGCDVPADLTDGHPELAGPRVAVFEHVPGRVARDLLHQQEGLPRPGRDALLTRFAAAWRARHDLALLRREPALVQEHGSFAHVLVSAERLVTFDLECVFRRGSIPALLAKEIVGYLRSLHRKTDAETFRADLRTLVRAYGDRPRLRAVVDEYRHNPRASRRLLWRLDRLWHRGESRVLRKYEVLALLEEVLDAEPPAESLERTAPSEPRAFRPAGASRGDS